MLCPHGCRCLGRVCRWKLRWWRCSSRSVWKCRRMRWYRGMSRPWYIFSRLLLIAVTRAADLEREVVAAQEAAEEDRDREAAEVAEEEEDVEAEEAAAADVEGEVSLEVFIHRGMPLLTNMCRLLTASVFALYKGFRRWHKHANPFICNSTPRSRPFAFIV